MTAHILNLCDSPSFHALTFALSIETCFATCPCTASDLKNWASFSSSASSSPSCLNAACNWPLEQVIDVRFGEGRCAWTRRLRCSPGGIWLCVLCDRSQLLLARACQAALANGCWSDCCRRCTHAASEGAAACCYCCRAAHRTAALPWLPFVAHLAVLGLLGRLAACRCCLLLLKLGTCSLLHLSGLQRRQRRSTASGESFIIAMPTRAALLFRRLRCRRCGLRRRFAGVLALRHICD